MTFSMPNQQKYLFSSIFYGAIDFPLALFKFKNDIRTTMQSLVHLRWEYIKIFN